MATPANGGDADVEKQPQTSLFQDAVSKNVTVVMLKNMKEQIVCVAFSVFFLNLPSDHVKQVCIILPGLDQSLGLRIISTLHKIL